MFAAWLDAAGPANFLIFADSFAPASGAGIIWAKILTCLAFLSRPRTRYAAMALPNAIRVAPTTAHMVRSRSGVEATMKARHRKLGEGWGRVRSSCEVEWWGGGVVGTTAY